MSEPSAADSKNSRIQSALREYLDGVDRGRAIDREEFLLRHPEIAAELRSLIEAEEQLRKLARAALDGTGADNPTQSFARHGQETLAPQMRANRSAADAVDGLKHEFGRYRIVRVLGRGAMGTVYLAEDTQLLRKVALKTPHFAQEPTSELLERFYREARAAATLRHPNICPVFDVGQIEGTHCISMAYIEGHPLSAFIHSAKLQPERQVLIIVRKLAQALADAHEHGIVHRDLKPANIMVDERNEPIIMDFGLAQQLKRDTNVRITQSGMLIGTPAYMSPEQVDGEPDKIGPPTDQYSLGVILYELLTGQLPFRGSIAAVMGQILMKETPPPSQLRAGLDPRIEAACLKMMAKQPSDRFASMSAVAAELETILRNPGGKPKSEDAAEPVGEAKPATSVSPTIVERPAESNTRSAGVPQSVAPNPLSENDLASLEELARKCLARHDYEQVLQIIERIPDEQRNAGVRALLKDAREKADEIAFLLCEIDEAVRFKDRPAALRKADELLKIKPGHFRAREIQEKFSKSGNRGPARVGPLRQFTRPSNEGGWVPWSALAFGLAVFAVMAGVVVHYLGNNGKNRNTIAAGSSVVAPAADAIPADRKAEQPSAAPAKNVAKAPPQPMRSAKAPHTGQAEVQAALLKPQRQTLQATAALIDVLPRLDLMRDRLKGEWQRAADGGVVPSGSPSFCSMHVPVKLSGDYRLELEFTIRRRVNENGIFLHVPVGDRYCRVAVLNDWIELSRAACDERRLPPPDGEFPWSRPILREGKKLGRYKTTTQEYGFGTFRDGTDINVALDQRYRALVDVRTQENDATITASLNGRLALDWTGSIASLSEPNDGNIWVGSKPSGLAFGAEGDVDVEFHTLGIQLLSGTRNRQEADQSEIKAANKNQAPVGSIATVTGRRASVELPVGSERDSAAWFELDGANGFWASDEKHAAYQSLKQVRDSSKEKLKCVAFAPNGNWVVLFGKNGILTSNPDLPACLKLKELQKLGQELKCVAFAPSGGWSVFWGTNGNWSDGVPEAAFKKMAELGNRKRELRFVAYGPEGSWVLRFDKAAVAYAGVPSGLAKALNDAVRQNNSVRCVAFASGDWLCLTTSSLITSNEGLAASKLIAQNYKQAHFPKWVAADTSIRHPVLDEPRPQAPNPSPAPRTTPERPGL